MAVLKTFAATLTLSSTALSQTFNSWPATNYGSPSACFDGNVSTSANTSSISFLFNGFHSFAGFYVQSSGPDFVTDYKVKANWNYPLTQQITAGQVCGATGNFTVVTFSDPDGNAYVRSDTWFLETDSAVTINEIWPIFVGDEIVDPDNTVACAPTTTAPATTTSTTPVATPTVSLDNWKTGSSAPIVIPSTGNDGSSGADAVDNDASTAWVSTSSAPTNLDLLFNRADTYAGLYIQSVPGAELTDFTVSVNDLSTSWVAANVTGNTESLVKVAFVDADGNDVDTISTQWFMIDITGVVGGVPRVEDVWPIWP